MSGKTARLRRAIVLAVTTVATLGAGEVGAMAAGETLCVGPASAPVSAPNMAGGCRPGERAVSLAVRADVDALTSRVGALESDNESLRARVAALESDNASLNARIAELEAGDDALRSDVGALQTTLSKVRYDAVGPNGLPSLVIEGANLQIVDGTGDTDGATTGLGNLLIGYNEESNRPQTGSHNIVVGINQSFTSFGGFLAGRGNTVSAPHASVTGGVENIASARGASVTGGNGNTADGRLSSVSGGQNNTTIGEFSSILGGLNRTVFAMHGTSP